ncbi:hypothetical protein [Comamonas resistens]|uniref:Lipoprotein n=1 Tax=Comamonas resistens TaxID=3046670 RepID=A0ABY8ST07_9BURK|nr:hypothetical protein [Comamonas resistens]MDL5039229.1 hypothetical protein [Comamonas resistens]WHS65880.1 hypothetical protein QMY55_01580 [Comamonas resistens]
MKKSLLSLAILGSALALSACSSISPKGAEVPQEYDYALSCKLKVDDPKKCEAQIRAMCDDPSKAVIRKSRHVDPKDDSVIYAYQAACNS